MNTELTGLAEHFTEARTAIFRASPLYQVLCPAVAADPATLTMLTARRAGQQPSFLLFGAVHDMLLAGAEHRLRDYYPSVVGERALAPVDAGPVFLDFCRVHRAALMDLIRTKLVQTNVVRRAIGLRFALSAIARETDRPVHLIEVGASAGLLLFVDRYRCVVGGQAFGPQAADVTLDCEWRGTTTPELGVLPPIASRIGIDLHPVDVTDAVQRRWLRALVWPEDLGAARLLDSALRSVVADPPRVLAGDAVDVCPRIGRELPSGEPRVVFHAAVRMHVPADRQPTFDAAIDTIGDHGPLYHVWLEPPAAPHFPWPADDRMALSMHGPDDDRPRAIVCVDGHLRWARPC